MEDDEHGQVDLDQLERRLDSDVAVVALTHIPTGGGVRRPGGRRSALAPSAGVPFLLDACQSVGQLDVDVATLGCDLLAATGRKFLRGPRGTGFLYASRAITDSLVPPVLGLGAAPWTSPTTYEVVPGALRFETWERSIADNLGLGAAVDYALSFGLPAIEERVTGLAARLREDLSQTLGVTVRDKGVRKSGIVTFTVDGMRADEVRARVAAAGVNVSVTRISSAQLDFGARRLTEVVRASPHYYTSDGELDRLLGAALTGQCSVRGIGYQVSPTGSPARFQVHDTVGVMRRYHPGPTMPVRSSPDAQGPERCSGWAGPRRWPAARAAGTTGTRAPRR